MASAASNEPTDSDTPEDIEPHWSDDARRIRVAKAGLVPFDLLALVGLFLGFSRRGEALYEPARVLLIPGGLGFTIRGALIAAYFFDPRAPQSKTVNPRTVGVGLATLGLAGIGVGLDHASPGPWQLLILPATITLCAFGVLLIIQPEAIPSTMRGRFKKLRARSLGLFIIAANLYCAAWSLGV